MAIELITGHAGSAHISAADAGWFNVGVVGEGKYVLDTGTQFACNVQSANLVTIGIGDALFEGRHVRVSATENVALDNGAQGVNRNDLICIKYEYASITSVESASIAVIKGTASSGTATDPDVPSGSILEGATTAYMPLWRIPISGITVGDPEKLYGDVLVTLEGMVTRALTADQIPNLPASKTTSGTFDVARIPNLPASKVGSGTLSLDRIPTLTAEKIPSLDASKIASGTLGVARGGTGKTYGFTWQQIKTWTGTAKQSWSKGSYSEFLIAARHGTDYEGATVLPSALIDSTAREMYMSGGYNASVETQVSGRGFGLRLSSTTAQAVVASVDGENYLTSTTWYIYGR